MRKFLPIILIISLISPVIAVETRHELYSNAVPSDDAIYDYFSDILGQAEKCLEKFLDEDASAVNISASLNERVMLTAMEARYYSLKGVRSNVSTVIPPFITLSSELEKLADSQAEFLDSMKALTKGGDYATYVRARSALLSMELSVERINGSLNDIEQLSLWNGSSELHFDVSGIRDTLKDVKGLIRQYSYLLDRYERKTIGEGITVTVSDYTPFLHQEVEIRVHAVNVTPTAIFIDGVRFSLTGTTMRYSFDTLGRHEIYAEGLKDGTTIRSNVVEVLVSRIPTHILLLSKPSALIGENVEISGFLSDFYGSPVNSTVTVSVDGAERVVETSNGLFSLNVTRDSEGYVNISASYAGNETYEASSANASIFFSRLPVTIYLEANSTEIKPNETVGFSGRITGVEYAVPVTVLIDSSKILKLNTSNEFNFTLMFTKPGVYRISVHYPGDALHRPATSSTVEIRVVATHVNLLLALVISAILLILYAMSRRKRSGQKPEPEKQHEAEHVKAAEQEERKIEEVTGSIEDVYRALFNRLVDRYRLRRSQTPRELLKSLKGEPFADKLRIITDLHERAVYGEIELDEREREMYFRLVTGLLEELE
ncbi:DUF4129 domain-containing protein [Geoglobus acetivorans]|uniref:DUF4129 domain-containing protein n=1 Tax=Geoglobus acetivorans TaxID=565033 RepID=A0ABZ3H4L0_GEOAI|nr:DUF4129 domain-containing protein [Geoglobus acetivorans]